MSSRVRLVARREVDINPSSLPAGIRLESLEVGAAPLVRLFLTRLDLPGLFQRHLPPLPGRPPALPSPAALAVLLANLLLARQPLYALADWAGRRVPEHLGLLPGQAALLNDDRAGRALDHLHLADRASLLTALVRRAITAFDIDLSELHQDTTTVTFSGAYANQGPAQQTHRPDLKQLLYSVTITADGAVPVHGKTYDGNTTDDQVHTNTWLFLRGIIGHSDFLYVADSKLCTRDNMGLIAGRQGRFLTVMPRTRSEDAWFRDHVVGHELAWREVHREPNPRRRDGPDVVYHGVESPQRSVEGYRVLWYRSSQKEEQDRQARAERLRRGRARLEHLRPVGRGGSFRSEPQARAAGQRVLEQEQVERWLRLHIDEEVEEDYRPAGPGRPGPNTTYRRIEQRRYRVRVEEDREALARDGRCDGLFPLITNDEGLSLEEALGKHKYQPFLEKRHEQLKAVFGVTPMWLKSVARVESLLWLYYVVELVQGLLERDVRRRMEQAGEASLALYPEGRASVAPTAELVLRVLEGLRRHRLLDEHCQELRRFHDQVPAAAQNVLMLLEVDPTAYGLD
jgi:transposase